MKRTSDLRLLLYLLLVLTGGLPISASASGLETKSLLDLYGEGGPVMHIIALCSVATLALAAYCAIMYRKAKMILSISLSACG